MCSHRGARAPAAAETATTPCLPAEAETLETESGAPKAMLRAELRCLGWADAEIARRWAARAARGGCVRRAWLFTANDIARMWHAGAAFPPFALVPSDLGFRE